MSSYKQIDNIIDDISKELINKPKKPLSRHIKQGIGIFCLKCGSTAYRSGFLGLSGEILCCNPDCENSKKRFR